MSDRSEYHNFDQLMRKLIKVPHSKINAKLEEEKANKKGTKRKQSNSSRSEANGSERTDPET